MHIQNVFFVVFFFLEIRQILCCHPLVSGVLDCDLISLCFPLTKSLNAEDLLFGDNFGIILFFSVKTYCVHLQGASYDIRCNMFYEEITKLISELSSRTL